VECGMMKSDWNEYCLVLFPLLPGSRAKNKNKGGGRMRVK